MVRSTDEATKAPGVEEFRKEVTFDPSLVVIDSCDLTWLFDPLAHRFCQIARGAPRAEAEAAPWRPYDHFVVKKGSDAFLVFLDSSGTRLLRSWRHRSPCSHCGADVMSAIGDRRSDLHP